MQGAIEFLLLAQQRDQAFELAATHDLIDHYAQHLGRLLHRCNMRLHMYKCAINDQYTTSVVTGSAGSVAEHLRIAAHFADRGKFEAAGAHHEQAGDAAKALELYLKAGPGGLRRAITLVGARRDPALVGALQQHLAGRGAQGAGRDPALALTLEVALGNWKQAAEQAVVLAKEQQDAGNYKARVLGCVRWMSAGAGGAAAAAGNVEAV